MPELLLFGIGLLVTLVVGLAVWSVGVMDLDESRFRTASDSTRPDDGTRR